MTEKVYLAFYKGRKTGRTPKALAMRFADWAIRTATGSPYSHCEIAIKEHEQSSVCTCFSASPRDGGVRVKVMPLPSEKWDLVELSHIKSEAVKSHLQKTAGKKYDLIGAGCAGLDIPWHCEDKWFCSEWCAAAIGLPMPHWHTPGWLYRFYRK